MKNQTLLFLLIKSFQLKYPKFKNIEFGIFSNDIILQSISILLDIFKLKIKFRNIFNILTKEYINNLWISEIFGKENRKYALKLIKIIQSTKNKEALIIVDLTKCMNSIDIKKELYKKPNMIELWSKCHIFIIQIHIKYYDEKLNYKRLIYVKLYANNFETLQFYIESFLKKNIKLSFNIILVYSISYNKLLMSKNTYLDLLPDLILLDSNNIHFQTSNNFFRTIANISNEKVNMKFNNAQVLFVSASKYNNSDSVVYMEDLNYKSQIKRNVHREKIQFQESNILDNLNNQNKKDFDIFQNNRVNISFPNKIIENVTNYKVFFLLNRDKKLLKYSNFSNTRFFNNEKHTNIKKSISFLKKGTTSTCFLIIFREIFVNFKNEFFENLNILNLNKCSKKSYKKAKNRLKKHEKSYSFFKDNHKSKIAVYDFKNNSFFSSGLSNLCFSVYDENIHGLLLSRKKSNIMTLSSKNSFTKNSLLTDMIFFTKNMFQTFKLSKDIYYETYEIKYSNDGYKLDQLLKKLLNSRLSNSQDSFCQNQTIFNRKAFYNTENKSHFEEISSLSNNNSDFIDEIENEQKMFWAIKPKKIVNRTCSERLNSNIDYFLDHNLGQKVSLNNTKVTNSINTSTGNIFSNEFFKSLFSISGNIENDHNSTLKHSISAKNIFEVPFSSNEWKLFPLIHIIYENLNFFFQNHDLNNPVIGQLFGLVNFSDIDYVLDVFLIFLGIISPIYYTNIRKCIKSIKTAAKKTVEVQKEYKNIFENNEQFILKSTELWEAKFQEMKLNKNNLSLVEINNMEKTPIFKWIKGKLIGKGRYGKVYLAMNVITGETLAVKQVKIYNNLNDADYEYQKILINALNIEIETMKDLDHPNIVQYLGYEKTKTTISIFLEYVSGGSIGRCLRKYGKIDQQTIQLFTRQILEGLTYLHSQGILHRDLKTDNILLDINGICKISDFGISKKSDDIYNDNVNMSMQGTIFWMAPEVIQNRKQGYSAKIDIWSLGCLVLEMFAGRRPWSDDEAIGAMFKLGNKSQPPPIPEDILTSINDDALDFLKSCFIINPDIRPTAQALLKHPFIEKSDPMFKFSDSMLSRLIRTEIILRMSIKKKKKNKHHQSEKLDEESTFQNQFSFGTLSIEEEKYFKGVQETLMTHHFSQEDYRLFVDNIFLEIDTKELKLAINPLYSKTLETLLQIASPFQLKKCFRALVGNFKKLICDRFGSHVCETLLAKSAYIASTEDVYSYPKDNKDIFITMENLILFMCNEILELLLTHINHKHASYVFRQLLLVLHGIVFQTDIVFERSIKHKRKMRSLNEIISTKQLHMPNSFFERKKVILDNINSQYGVTDVRNLAFNQYGSQVISVLLLIERDLIKNDKSRKQILLEKLVFGDFQENSFDMNSIKKTESDSFIETLLRDQVGSHIFESIVEFSSKELLEKLYNIYFKNKIFRISKHPIGNYVLQKFIEKNKNYQILNEIFEEIIIHFEELIDIGHTGILISLINSCSQDPLNSNRFIKVLKKCFTNSETETINNIFPLILNLDPRNKNNSLESYKKILNDDNNIIDHIKIQGAYLIKSFFRLPYEIYYFLIESLIFQDKKIILYYATNKIGSSVLETVLRLPALTLSDKRKLLNNFFESYSVLSCDPSGSHIVDACLYTSIGLNNYRERIADELLKSSEIIRDDYYGKKIWKNWQMNIYKNNFIEWKKSLNSFVQKELLKSQENDRVINTDILNLDLQSTNNRKNSLVFDDKKRKLKDNSINNLEEEIDMLFRKKNKK
ncbi:hypothetical protein PORY_000862 [Pneumocystis oryctolagi]|uniref:Uncharacterized protein n=1 Tax=Pneumocystis oryctolagi TaxID=42067 RepID=A0ACB7CGY0_9ASCO|nr:hypothetical protein PORY_000862 [Pneumocystis oryctolagi]